MIFWIVLACATSFFGLFQNFVSKKYIFILSNAFLVLIGFISAFRYMIGWDYESYIFLYNKLEIGDLYPEISFQILVVLLRKLNFDFQSIFVVYSFFTILFVWQGIKKYIEDAHMRNLALVLFVITTNLYWNSFSIIRQSLAIAIIFWGARFIFEKKILKYFSVVFLATIVHYSAIVMLAFYFVGGIYFKKIFHIVFVLLSIIICKFDVIMPVVQEMVQYIEIYENHAMPQDVFTSIGLGVIFKGIVWSIITFRRKYERNNNKENFIYNMYTFSFALFYMFYFYPPLARLSCYLEMFHIVAIVLFLKSFNYKKKYFLMIFYLLCTSIIFIHNIIIIPEFQAGIIHPYFSATNINYEFNFNIFK